MNSVLDICLIAVGLTYTYLFYGAGQNIIVGVAKYYNNILTHGSLCM